MAYSLLAHTIGVGASGTVTTSAIDTTGADLIVVVVAYFEGITAPTLSDNKSNTWTGLTAQVGTTDPSTRIYYCQAPTVGAGHTFKLDNGGLMYGNLAVTAWSGSVATPFDQQNGTTHLAVTSLQTGSVTPGTGNQLVIAAVSTGAGSSGAYSIDSGFTISDQEAYVSGGGEGCGMAYLVQTSAAAVNPSWSWTGSAEGAVAIGTFKDGAAAAATIPWPFFTNGVAA